MHAAEFRTGRGRVNRFGRFLICFLLFLSVTPAMQTVSLGVASGSATPGSTVTLDLVVGSSGLPASLQWTLNYSPANITSIQVDAGAVAAASGKTISCAAGSGSYTCLVYGLNSNTINDGVVARVTVTISPTTSTTPLAIGLTNVVAASLVGDSIYTTATGGAITVALPTPIVPAAISCNPVSLTGAGTSTCAVSLTATAPSGGLAVSLSSNNGSVSAPASVTVVAGAINAMFTVTAAAVSADTSAQITATMNGTSTNTSLSLIAPTALSTLSCTPASLSQGASSTCTVGLTKAAPSGGLAVSLSSNNAALAVPASVTVASGATIGIFTATAGSVSSTQNVTVTASAAGVSKTALVAVAAVVQNVTLGLSSGSAAPGATVALDLIVNSADQPASMEWTLNYSSANITAMQVDAGTVAVAAGKSISCAAGSGGYTCLVYGVNSNTIGNGVVARVTATLSPAPSAASVPIGITNVVVASLVGDSIPATATGGAIAVVTPTVIVVPAGIGCSPASLTGAGTSTCTVSLTAAAPSGGLSVSLSSNNGSVTVPASVTVASGVASAVFTATAAAVSTDTNVQITASLNGASANASLSLIAPAVLSTLSCAPASLSQGSRSTCTVGLTKAAPSAGFAVSLSSNNAALTVPASMTVASGATSGIFTATAGSASTSQSATVTASAAGVNKTASVMVTAAAGLSGISCSPSSLTGAGTSTCTVSLTAAAPSGGLSVSLLSNNGSVTVPATVAMASGATSVAFTATAAAVSTDTNVQITASLNGASFNTSLSLIAPAVLSTLNCTPATLSQGASSTCTVGSTKTAPGGGLAVALSSSNLAAVTVPASVTIAGGSTSTTFTATASASGVGQSSITAAAGGTSRSASVSVSAAPVVSSVSCNTGTIIDSGNTACTVSIIGAAPAGGVSVLLSSNNPSLSVPASVMVPVGASSASFQASIATISTDGTARITASLGGSSASFPITLQTLKLVSLQCGPNPLNAGGLLVCKAALNAAPVSSSIVIRLSSNSSAITVPATATVRVGSSSAKFLGNSDAGAAAQTVHLTATIASSSVSVDINLLASQKPKLKAPQSVGLKAGETAKLQVSAVDSDGQPVSVAALNLPEGMTFDAASGEFNWTPREAQAGSYTVQLSATDSQNRTSEGKLLIEVGSAKPMIRTLANGASGSKELVCSPGSVARVIGAGFLEPGANAGSVSVKVNGSAVPVIAASSSRVTFQCPQLPLGTALEVVVETPVGVSEAVRATMRDATPGIFTLNAAGRGQGSIVHAGTTDLAVLPSPSIQGIPARPADIVTIIATGLGPVDSSGVALIKPSVYFGDISAEVLTVTVDPATPGVYYADVRIPKAAAVGDEVPVRIQMQSLDGRVIDSNTVTVTVEENR